MSPPPGLDAAEQWPYRPEAVADRVVAQLAARHPELTIESVRLAGAVWPALHSQCGDAEMLVLGMRGEGGYAGLHLGSTAETVAGACEYPVVLVPSGLACEGPVRRPDKVALGVDTRDPAGGAIDFALGTALRHSVPLHALHAGEPPLTRAGRLPCSASAPVFATHTDQEMELLSDVLRPWREKYPDVRVLEDVVLMDPAKALVRTSGSAELTVVGRRREGGLGPVAGALAQHTKSPVAVVAA